MAFQPGIRGLFFSQWNRRFFQTRNQETERMSLKQRAVRITHSQGLAIQLDARLNYRSEKGNKKPVGYLLCWKSNKVKSCKLAADDILMGKAEGRKASEGWNNLPPPFHQRICRIDVLHLTGVYSCFYIFFQTCLI